MDGENFEGVVIDAPVVKTAAEKANESRNLRRGCLVLIGLAVGLAAVVGGGIALDRYSESITWMVGCAIVAVLALLRSRFIGRSGLLCAAAVVIILAGVEADFFPAARLIGTVVALVGVAVLLPGIYLQEARATRRGVILALVWGLTVGVGLFGAAGLIQHASPGFVRHFGERVTVSPGGCVWNMDLRNADNSNVFCSSSSWRYADGTDVTGGALTGSPDALLGGPFQHVSSATAYAYEDSAVTLDLAREPGPIAQLGLISGWLALAPLLALVVTLGYRRRRSTPDQPISTPPTS